MSDSPFLTDALGELRKYKGLAERALAQIDDKQWFATTDPEANSVGIVVKHITGNMRSRWTDFLTTDGEKADRARDTEFELYKDDTVEGLKKRWDVGWKLVFDTLEPLNAKDLDRSVTIRGEPHTVLQAVMRQLTHYSSHIGQIMFLCRQLVGPKKWKSLSIPRGQSKAYEVSKSGAPYKPGDKKK